MKEQIDKLFELAKDYVVFGIEIGLPDAFNRLRGGYDGNPEISIFFKNGGELWSVKFKDVSITGYSNSIEMPLHSDPEYLNEVYDSAKKYLDEHLLPNVSKCTMKALKEKQLATINKLETELNTIKYLI
jgi:hypothetical protein